MSDTQLKIIAERMETLNSLSKKIEGCKKGYLNLELLIYTMPDCKEKETLVNMVIDMRLKEINMEIDMLGRIESLSKMMTEAENFYISSENKEFNGLEHSTCDKMKAYFEMEKKNES